MAAASKASGAGKKKAATKKAVKKAAPGKAAAAKVSAKKTAGAKAPRKKAAASKKSAAAKGGSARTGASRTAAKKSGGGSSTAARSGRTRSPFGARFLEQMRKLLVSERATYERQAAQLRAEAEALVADLDPGDVQFDEESGEGDTIAVERGQDLALAARALDMIDEIDHALSKFDLGTYGICEVSGEPIPEERLEAIPWARERVEYKVGGFGRR